MAGQLLGTIKAVVGNKAAWENLGVALGVVAAVIGGALTFVANRVANVVGAILWAVDTVSSVLNAIADVVTTGIEAISSVFDGAGETMGGQLISGLVSAITGGASSVVNAISNMATQAIAKAKSIFEIASPSRVMMGIGENIAQGAAIGVDRGAPSFAGSMGDMMAAPMPAAGAGRDMLAGSGGTTNNITIGVDPGAAYAAAQVSDSPEQYAAAVRQMLVTSFVDELELAAVQLGR